MTAGRNTAQASLSLYSREAAHPPVSPSSIPPSYKALPSVSETFPTLRSMIEALNADASPRCLQQL